MRDHGLHETKAAIHSTADSFAAAPECSHYSGRFGECRGKLGQNRLGRWLCEHHHDLTHWRDQRHEHGEEVAVGPVTTLERLLTLQLKVKEMELDNLRTQVESYAGLVNQLVSALAAQPSAGVDKTAIQAVADHLGQINSSLQAAIASIIQPVA